MITDGKKWHYLAVTNLSALLQGNSSNHEGDFYCLNCFNSYTTKNKLKEHEEICNNHDSCRIEMPKWVEKILKYNPGEKSLKAPFAFYLDLECLLKKEQSCQNNPEKSYTERKAKHETSGWVTIVKCSFDAKKGSHDYYRGIDCIEKLCKKLKDYAMETINYEEKEMIPLTGKENNSYKKQKVCHICKKHICYDKNEKKELKKPHKVRDHCHYTGKFRGAAHSICNLRYKTPKEIPVVFHNGSTYDYHFIIKQLAKEFDGQFECLGENTEKYITFSVPIKKP